VKLFLRALAAHIDGQAGVPGRDALLREVGRQMAALAALAPLAAVTSLEALAAEMDAALEAMGWGRTRVALLEAERALLFTHAGLPLVGGQGDPPGLWLAAALEGLYEGWMAAQPGAEAGMEARRVAGSADQTVVIRYARGSGLSGEGR
jgi:hypothetical protein